MAKAKTGGSGAFDDTGDNGTSIGFIGEIIDRSVADLEARLAELPPDAAGAREAVRNAIAGLKFTATSCQLICKSWFMPSR